MDGLSCEKCQFFFEHPLNGWTFGLNLPSQVLGPIIFNDEFNGTHLGSRFRGVRPKHQIPSTKFQTSSNVQNPKSQTRQFGSLELEVWNLFGIWNLKFGISEASFISFFCAQRT
jgi:hypothetical protein